MITYKLKINCQEPRVLVSDMEFVAGDVNAYRLEFTFYDNGEKISLSDKILTVKGKRADGTILSGSGQIEGAQATFVPANAFYAVPGELLLEIALTDSAGNYMTTKILSASVLEGLGESTEMATTNVSAYVTLLAQLANRLDSADQLIAETKSFYESELTGVSDFMKNKPAIENGEGVGSLVGAVPESLIEDETDFANTATADNAVTFGKSNKNNGKSSLVTGKGNVNIGANSLVAGQYNAGRADTLLELGNGASENARSNAFEVYTDGSISLDNGETKLTPASIKCLVTLKDEVDDIDEKTERLQNNTERAILDMQNQCSNALKAKANGEVIRIDDMSPVEHTMRVKVSSKNVIPYPYTNTTLESGGITFTDNGDGSLTVNGTATGQATFRVLYDTVNKPQIFEDGVTYYNNIPHSYISYNDENGVLKYESRKTFTWDDRYKLGSITIRINAGVTIDNETWYPQIEAGTSPTNYTPYVDVSTTTLKICGKNLVPSQYGFTEKTSKGITAVVTSDSSVTISGTLAEGEISDAVFRMGLFDATHYRGATLCIPAQTVTGVRSVLHVKLDDGTWTYNYLRSDRSSSLFGVIPDNAVQFDYSIAVNSSFVGSTTGVYPSLELGGAATEYEPYKEPITYKPNVDGVVEGVESIYPNMTITTDVYGVVIECEYNKDINKAFAELQQAIISLGGNV